MQQTIREQGAAPSLADEQGALSDSQLTEARSGVAAFISFSLFYINREKFSRRSNICLRFSACFTCFFFFGLFEEPQTPQKCVFLRTLVYSI